MSELLEALRNGRDHWMAAVKPLTAVEWRHRPEPEGWSPAELAEHIMIVEDQLVTRVEQGVAENKMEPEKAAALAGKEEALKKRIPGRKVRVKSPEAMVPTGRLASPSSFIAEFQTIRARSLKLAENPDPAIGMIVMPHFALGDLTGHQWLWFIALHGERHLNQLREGLTPYCAE